MSDKGSNSHPARGGLSGPQAKLLFINRSYWPDTEATGQLLTELCEDLASDFHVTVICGQPRKGIDFGVSNEAVRLRELNGVQIRRVRHTQFDKSSWIGRLVNMLTFQMMATWAAMTAARADVIITETDPPFLCILGRMVQLLHGGRLVCYLQDIYPDIAVALKKLRAGWIARILRLTFFNIYRCCDAVVVLSEDMRDLMLANRLQRERLYIIPNWVDTSEIYPIKSNNDFRHQYGFRDKFVVMYNGNLGMSQNLSQVLDAAELLHGQDGILVVLVGEGAERANLERIVQAKGLRNVKFLGYQPKSAAALSAPDVHVVILQPEVQQLLMPSKLYGVLASGTPAIVIADRNCELARIVRENDLGVVLPPNDPEQLAESISSLAAQPSKLVAQGVAARRYAEIHCGRERSVSQFRALVCGLSRPAKCAVDSKERRAATLNAGLDREGSVIDEVVVCGRRDA
jgi:glycosyltransferase involved in cell wall biosynthesis